MKRALTGNQMFAQLLTYRNSRGSNIYRAISLTKVLLKNRDWVESPSGGGGDEDKALTRLEKEVFADICGAMSVTQMLEIIQHFPNEADWKINKYNLRKMWVSFRATTARTRVAAPREQVPSTLSFIQMTPSQQRQEFNRVKDLVEKDEDKIARLEKRNQKLEEENVRLRRENHSLKNDIRRVKEMANRMAV